MQFSDFMRKSESKFPKNKFKSWVPCKQLQEENTNLARVCRSKPLFTYKKKERLNSA